MLKSDNQTAIREIRRRLMSPDIPRHAPQEIRQLLAGLLNSDPQKRLGSPELGGIQSIQQQPLFRDFKWDDLRSPLKEELLVVKWIKLFGRNERNGNKNSPKKLKIVLTITQTKPLYKLHLAQYINCKVKLIANHLSLIKSYF